MPVITAVSRDDPLKVGIFLLVFQTGLLLTWLGLVRSLDFLSREFREFDANAPVHTNLVSSHHRTVRGDKS
jgi:hypothetical protein